MALAPKNTEFSPRRRGIGLERPAPLALIETLPSCNRAVAMAHAEAGLSVFPADWRITPTKNEPEKISKASLVAAWRDNSTSDLKQIRRWWRKWPDALPAIDCGKSGLLVIDPDRKPGRPDGVTPWNELTQANGGLPPGVPVVETANGGGLHFYFRADERRGNSTGSLPAGIDVRGDGGYVIAPGAIMPDGRCWSATDGLTAFLRAYAAGLPAIPEWLDNRLGGKRDERTNAPIAEPVFPSMDELRKAVEAIPNDEKFDSREEWRNVVSAIKHEALLHGEEDEGFQLAREWSAEWDNSEAADTHFGETWDSLKRSDAPNARTGKTILRLASKHGYCLPFADKEFEDERPRDADRKTVERRERKPSRPKMRLENIEAAAALALTRVREPLIDGLLDEGAMSVAYGPSNVGKTFVVLDMALAVATGRPWNGMATTRSLVVYVAAEGGFGVNQRLLALLRKYEREAGEGAPKPLFALVKYPVDLQTNDADADELCRLVEDEERARGVKCAWVIVDTLARAMAGGDENSSVDMGRIVKTSDRIRDRTGAHFTFVHHTGKDVAKGARGHSCLRAATDTELEVCDGKLSVEKQRDMRIMQGALSFSLKQVDLGNDSSGRPVTSAIVEWCKAASGHPTSKLDDGEAAFVHAVESAIADHGFEKKIDGRRVRVVDRAHVREKFYAACSADKTTDAKRSAFNRNEKSKAVATIVSSHDDGLTQWIYLNRDYVGFDMQDETATQDEFGAFGKRSSGQPQAADRDRPPSDLCALRSRRSQPVMTAATASGAPHFLTDLPLAVTFAAGFVNLPTR